MGHVTNSSFRFERQVAFIVLYAPQNAEIE